MLHLQSFNFFVGFNFPDQFLVRHGVLYLFVHFPLQLVDATALKLHCLGHLGVLVQAGVELVRIVDELQHMHIL